MLIDLAEFRFGRQPEDKLLVAISQPWYNGSYTMTAKPIKTLELHYIMIQFLIKINSQYSFVFNADAGNAV